MVMSKMADDGHDYVALSWVKAEIVSNLEHAQQTLKQLVDNANSLDENDITEKLTICHELLHQVSGALQMVGFPGATLFAEEMKLLSGEILQRSVEDFNNSLQILIQAVLQMPSYLDIIQTEGQDIPIALLPLINQMRECYKANSLSEIELFSPKYYGPSSSLTDEELKEINTEGLTNLLRKLRQSLQLSLIDLIQNRNFEVAVDHLIKIFNYLGRLCKTTVISKFWQAAQAFVIAINEKSIPNSLDTKLLLKQIDLQIKLLTEKGVAGMNVPAPDDLLKELLFLLSSVESDSAEIQKIKKEFQLTTSTFGITDINQHTSLEETGRPSFALVSQALKIDFNFIQGKLELFTDSTTQLFELEEVLEKFKKISNTLEVLGLPEQRTIINQENELRSLIADGQFSQEHQLNMKKSLADVEKTIVVAVDKFLHDETSTVRDTTIKEVAYELVKVKDILSLYFDSEGEEGGITDVPVLLTHAVHKLGILSQYTAAAVAIRCLQYIEDHFINDFVYPDNKSIEHVVGAIASIDYYMDCLIKNQIVSAGNVLDFAKEYLVALNYSLPDDCQTIVSEFISSNAIKENNQNDKIPEDIGKELDIIEADEPIASTQEVATPIINVNDENIVDDELVEIFSEEMDEIFETLSIHLPIWTGNTYDNNALKEVRRAFHTIKGSGRMVKAVFIGELGWSIENMLNRVLDNTISPSASLLALVKKVVDILPELVKEYAAGKQHERQDVNNYMEEANALATGQDLPVEHSEVVPEEVLTEEIPDITETVQNNEQINEVPIEIDSTEVKIDKYEADSQDFDTELVDVFVAEARVHMQVLRAFIYLCEQSLPQTVTDSLQRAMHTLKGSSLMANLGLIANIAKPFEAFLKECSINGWRIDKIDFELLKDAYSLLNEGINQLELHSLAPIEGTEALVERIRLRRDDLLSQLELNVTADIDKDSELSTAQSIANLLTQVDLLLDAEDYIKAWWENKGQEFAELQGLQHELNAILPMAIKIGLESIVKLINALLKAYQAIIDNMVVLNDAFFIAFIKTHQVLLNCIDQLAAAQSISDHNAEIMELEKALVMLDKHHEVASAVTKNLVHDDLIQEDTLVLGAPAPKGPIIQSDHIDADMAEIFLEEADDILEQARNDLDDWIKDQKADALKDLQRQLHTLKGGARMCGAVGLGDIAHGLEFIYEGLLNGRYSYSADLVELLNKAHDSLQLDIDTLHDKNVLLNNPALLNAIQVFRKEGRVILDDFSTPDVDVSPTSVIEDTKAIELVADKDNTAKVDVENTNTAVGLALVKDEENYPNPIESSGVEDSIVTDLGVTDDAINAPEIEETLENKISILPEKELSTEVPVTETQPPTAANSIAKEAFTLSDGKAVFKLLEVTKLPVLERVDRETNKEVTEQVKVSAELLDNLVNLAGETSIYRGRIEQQNSDLASVLLEMESTVDRVRDQLRRLDIETQSQIISRHQTETVLDYADFDPLEMDQYSQLQQLSRSLFETASDLFDLKDTLKRRNHDISGLLQQQARINTELQEGLMHTRMVPLDRIAPRLRRLVRQVSSELGKDVDLVIGNTAGEMDRGVIDAIIAPLEHMIRNSLDHGIEKREIRVAAGKPERGTITLDLIREGGEMVLRLKDDGAGISIAVVKEKAISKGLMEADEVLSDKEILQFILEAGFSTAKKITQISGRGVGLDVVVNAVKQLGGALTLDAEEGKGTTFSIRLPINLSVSRALMARVGEENYAIPMSSVEGVTYISAELQKEFYQFGAAELEYGNESYRVKYLGELLGNRVTTQPQHIIEERAPVLLVRSGDYYMALRVDELLPSSEVVVKSLGIQFLSVPAISGATILGDGNVIIILDLSALVRSYFTSQHQAKMAEDRRVAHSEVELAPELFSRPPLVMVVDDSVTVRKVTTRLLERQGMEVVTARDGLDAVTQLDERIPDIMLLDIEMPRMDGFEVATRVRHDARTKHLPIIMITSRSGDKHRERALGIGVNEYMSKPFMDARLIKTISDLLPAFQVNLLESSS
ncbi:hybrid sensor histidine kinase/response regulator [Entomomonas moraniae]|nr:Hpt domain-containing protein [Entomomonas moraniae]